MADMKEKIEAFATTLQAQVQGEITELLQWRPAYYTIFDQPAFVPKEISFAVNSALPSPVALGLATIPEPPTLDIPVISEITLIDAPTFEGSFEMRDVAAPTALATKSFTAPAFSLPASPTAPTLADIAAPNLADVPIPEPMNLAAIPVFSAAMPAVGNTIDLPYTDNPLSGFNTTLYNRRVYQSEELDIISEELQKDITEGRTGIPKLVEDDIWKRQAERDLIALNDSITLTRNSFAKRGFSLPPGKMRRAEQRLIEAHEFTKLDRSREIAASQADSTQKNRQFAVTSALQLEQSHMQFAIQTAGFMLDVARETVNAGIAIYNAHIAKMGIELDVYKTEATVYESQLRAYSVRIEAYKGELEGAKLRGDLNIQQIDTYKAKLAAQELLVSIYTARVNAVASEAGIQKLKLDAFRGEIEAYQAEVQAKSSEFQAFEAQLKGEVAKAQVFESQVNTFRARVEATGEANRALAIRSQAEGSRASAMADVAKVGIANYQAHIERFKAESLIALEAYKGEISAFLAQIDLAKTAAGVEQGNQNVSVEVWKAQQTAILGRAQIMSANVASENAMKSGAMKLSGDLLHGILNALQAVGIEIVKINK